VRSNAEIEALTLAGLHDQNYKFGWLQGLRNLLKGKKILVAGVGFEPTTFGL